MTTDVQRLAQIILVVLICTNVSPLTAQTTQPEVHMFPQTTGRPWKSIQNGPIAAAGHASTGLSPSGGLPGNPHDRGTTPTNLLVRSPSSNFSPNAQVGHWSTPMVDRISHHPQSVGDAHPSLHTSQHPPHLASSNTGYGGHERPMAPQSDTSGFNLDNLLGVGQCGYPRWFDVYVGTVYLTKESNLRSTDLSMNGPIAQPIVLRSADAEDDDDQVGIQLTARRQLGIGKYLELDYYGLMEWSEKITVTNEDVGVDNNLYSVFSQFGLLGAFGFVETDQAALHSIEHKTDLDTVEANVRRFWITDGFCRLTGSNLVGIRYFRLDDQFQHQTIVVEHADLLNNGSLRGPGSVTYDIESINETLGAHVGTAADYSIFPWLRLGTEAKIGAFVTRAKMKSSITYDPLEEALQEAINDEDLTGIAEGKAYIVVHFSSRASFRAGYQILFAQNLALAPEQFNGVAPSILAPPPGENRQPFLEMNGDLTVQGFTAGIEWNW